MKEAKSVSFVSLAADDLVIGPMDENVEHWLQREIQLNQMHEEIIAKREANLCRRSKKTSPEKEEIRQESEEVRRAKARNQSLLEEIATAQSKLLADGNRPVSPRFSTLQNNYWVMVKNILPIWEEELLDFNQKQRERRQRSPMAQRHAQQRSPKSLSQTSPGSARRPSPKMFRRSPNLMRRSPKVTRRIDGS